MSFTERTLMWLHTAQSWCPLQQLEDMTILQLNQCRLSWLCFPPRHNCGPRVHQHSKSLPPKEAEKPCVLKPLRRSTDGDYEWKYNDPCKDYELDASTKRQFVMNTEKKIKWVLRIFCQWREHNLADPSCDPRICRSDLRFPSKLELSDVAYTLKRFLTEIHKMNGSEYLPRILYQMVLYFQMHFEIHKVY